MTSNKTGGGSTVMRLSDFNTLILLCISVYPPKLNGHTKMHRDRRPHGHSYESSTMLSSDLETTSFFDSEDDTMSRYIKQYWFCVSCSDQNYSEISIVKSRLVISTGKENIEVTYLKHAAIN